MMTNKEIREKVNIFDSAEWNKRKEARFKKLTIKDDKGKKHKVGEIFESETISLEVN